MSPLVRKEIRLILPAGIATVLPLLPAVALPDSDMSWLLLAAVLPAILLGIASFGQELNCGTFGLLLAQPVLRRDIWRAKMGVLVVPLLLTWLAIAAICFIAKSNVSCSQFLLLLEISLIGLTSALLSIVLVRQVLAAFWIALILPLILFVPWFLFDPSSDRRVFTISLGIEFAVFSVAAYWAARRAFDRAQDVPVTGGSITFGLKKRLLFAPIAWMPNGAIKSLFRKEIQLHQTTIVFIVAIAACHIAAVIARKWVPETQNTYVTSLLRVFFGFWFFFPPIIGATAFAEERNLNTLTNCLCLPASRRVQFLVKITVALAVCLISAGLLSPLIEYTSLSIGVDSSMFDPHGSSNTLSKAIAICSAIALGLGALAFYTSTLSKNLLQAMGIGAALVPVGLAIFWLAERGWDHLFLEGFNRNNPFEQLAPINMRRHIFILIAGAMTLAMVVLAWKNSSRVQADGKLWIYNLVAISASAALAFFGGAFFHIRGWEFVLPLEAAHGSAQLQGTVRPKICPGYKFAFAVLLPDGRIWSSWQFASHLVTESSSTISDRDGVVEKQTGAYWPTVPISGRFIGSSNWVDVVHTRLGYIGLKSDGTLWNWSQPRRNQANFLGTNRMAMPVSSEFAHRKPILSLETSTPQQIGTESNWTSIGGGNPAFCAVKKDGTLWAGGWNDAGWIPENVPMPAQPFHRVGSSVNWAKVISGEQMDAVMQDGSFWQLNIAELKADPQSYVPNTVHVDPFHGANIVAISSRGPNYEAALTEAGDLLVSTNRVTPVKSPGLWKAVSLMWAPTVIGLKNNGTLEFNDPRPFLSRTSKNRDWITLNDLWWAGPVALASDGTLACWEYNLDLDKSLTMPSRKPAWSVNLLK